MKSFSQKTVVITGAGSGIGRALAIRFAAAGAKLALNDYRSDALEETRTLLDREEEDLYCTTFDVSNRQAMLDFAEKVAARLGKVDVMVNNAGVALTPSLFEEVEIDKFDRLHEINFKGTVNGCHAFLPLLTQRPEAALVNVASVFSFGGVMRSAAYVSSKFAVYGFTQSLIQEYWKTGLKVHSVHPAGVKTNITRNSLSNQPSFDELAKRVYKLSPEYAADKIIKGIRKKKSRILIGRDAYLLDWVTRIAPIGGSTLLNNVMRKTRNAMDKIAGNDVK